MMPARSYLPTRAFSTATSDSFLSIVGQVARAHRPTVTQLNALESAYRSTGDFLADHPDLSGLVEQIHPHGSRDIGTTIRPADATRDGFDIDLVARYNQRAFAEYSVSNN